jgi:hypothetical protein
VQPEAAAAPAGLTPDGTLPLARGERARKAPDRFSATEHSQWSAYDLSRLDSRHERVHKAVEQARSSEPALAAELDALFSRLRAATSEQTSADPASELVGEMERVAATTLHSALLEMLHASGVTEADCHIWAADSSAAGSAPPVVSTVKACMPDPSGSYKTVWGVRHSISMYRASETAVTARETAKFSSPAAGWARN